MIGRVSSYIVLCLAGAIALAAAVGALIADGRDEGFRDTLVEYIERNSTGSEVVIGTPGDAESGESAGDDDNVFTYRRGDWSRYVVTKEYRRAARGESGRNLEVSAGDAVNVVSYGSMKMNLLYGKSSFTRDRYRQFDEDRPVSKIIQSGFYPERELQLHIEGTVGKRLKLYIDHDSRKNDNRYVMKYTAESDDEVIREINAGEVDIRMNNSKYVVFDDNTQKGLGIDLTMKKNRLKVKAFGTVTRGEAGVERFRGNSSASYMNLQEYQYLRNRYFQLEPFKRYDNLSSPPTGAGAYTTLVTFTSSPADPVNYAPYSVNIDASSFELYLDDQNPHNNYNAVSIPIDNGSYVRLSSGVDYTINFATGLITFIRQIPANARIFALYTVNGGSTASSDNSARTDVFPGKIFVYLKYGYSLDEDVNRDWVQDADRNGDGRMNLDIYEVRSFYSIGDRRILDENFRVDLYRENSLLTKGEASKAGRFTVDTSNGILSFNLREPFRALLGSSSSSIYSEAQLSGAYLSSRYRLRVNYYRESRSFQLKHTNILPESVRVRINGRELAKSLYSVDNTSGFFQFTDPGNPVIGAETDIEIRYEYLPFGGEAQSFIAGVRADYDLGRNLDIGGTFVFSRGSGGTVIPKVGSEPEQLMIFEGDAKLYLGEKRLRDLINNIPGVKTDSVPFEVTGYAEYAKSYKNVNTFGKGLIDDMESGDEVVSVSLSERDWVLSSPPAQMGLAFVPSQANRGSLQYLYYRSLGSAETVRGLTFTPFTIDYAVKPGPYNVATGHLGTDIQHEENQRSLAFKFDFTGGKQHVSVATRRLSSQAVDFTGLQYVEIWFRSSGGSGTADLYLDIGRINEDADGDGAFDSEDLNNNGYLDVDPSIDLYEDRGYVFNPAGGTATKVGSGPQLNSFTMGDGALNTEDLNGNGVLDVAENAVRLPGNVTSPATAFTINLADTTWQKMRIYLNRNSAAFLANPNLYQDILKQVDAIRLFIAANTATAGTIYIDRISFVSSRWRNIKLDGVLLDSPDEFGVTVVDSFNDEEYRSDAFIFRQAEIYKSLHGEKSDSQLEREKESAIAVKYDLSARTWGSVTRRFQNAMDLRFYRTMNLWFNFKEYTPGDMVAVTVGSSDNDYLEYRFPVENIGIWREVTLRLQDGSAGAVAKSKTAGSPDMKRISFIEVAVYGEKGRFWLNDIYVSDPETLKDSAYWVEGEIRSKRALARTDSGVPILSDLHIKYIVKGHGSQFGSIGKTVSDMSEQFHQLFTSVKILPNWSASADFSAEKTVTDSLNEQVHESARGATGKRSAYFETFYASELPLVPSVKVIYKHDSYDNARDEFVAGYAVTENTSSTSRAPTLWVEEKVNDFLGGALVTTFQMNTVFREEEIQRKSTQLSVTDLSQYASIRETESRQKGAMRLAVEYQSKKFYIQPVLDLGSQEVVRLSGKGSPGDTKILEEVNGDFHPPLLYRGDYRFVERNKNADIKAGFRGMGLVNPSFGLSMYYLENRFRDYTGSEKVLAKDYSRAKDARSFIASRIDMPLAVNETGFSRFMRSFVVGFSRSIYFQETEIPYEGEGVSEFGEDYGIRRAYGGISGGGLNLVRYNPVHFLTGRGNYSNGRDYVHGSLNEGLSFSNGISVPNYTNSLRLIDTMSLSSAMSFGAIDSSLTMGLNHLCERQAVLGVPQQVVTLTTNAGLSMDLMQIVHFGFFRANGGGLPHHAANISAGYGFSRNMIITANIQENVHSPNLGITFKRDRASLGFKGSVDFRLRSDKEYIPLDQEERSREDDIYVANMSSRAAFKENDRGYRFTAFFETDVIWLHALFSQLYELASRPIFSLEYSLLLNRYDYSVTVAPEPYDQHLVSGRLTLDLHRNVQGGLIGRWALEKFRNRETNGVYREIMSYELGLNFTLLF